MIRRAALGRLAAPPIAADTRERGTRRTNVSEYPRADGGFTTCFIACAIRPWLRARPSCLIVDAGHFSTVDTEPVSGIISDPSNTVKRFLC